MPLRRVLAVLPPGYRGPAVLGVREAQPIAQAALKGVNAAVVGLLLAALYTPLWTSAIGRPVDFAIAAVAFLLLVFWKVPPWLVVVLGALASAGAAWIV